MAHNLVDVDTWTAAVTVPDDGDAANAASVEAGMQDLGDRTYYLYNRVAGAAAGVVLPVPIVVAAGGLTRFAAGYPVGGIANEVLVNDDTTDAGRAGCIVTGLPISGTIVRAVAMVTGLWTAGAHAGLVGTAPTVSLYRRALSTGVDTAVVATADPHATTNLALYEVPHEIDSGVIAESITSDRCYRFHVTGENGANKANDKFAVYGFKLTIDPA